MKRPNPFDYLLKELPTHGKYYSLLELKDSRYETLPYTIRILLEAIVRNCDEFQITKTSVEHTLDWEKTSETSTEIPFKPSRVLLQDFTGVPAAVDLAGLRDATKRLGGDIEKINPLVPVDLVIDHSVQVDDSRNKDALQYNEKIEFIRNRERFAFLKWVATAFSNMLIVPPGSGIVHQVNLEYLGPVVHSRDGLLYCDSVVGTDSHTTMIDGLGVAGWGVGGIEAEAVMLGQPISMVLPEVVGFELVGQFPLGSTATDLVLTITQILRHHGVVGKFVEFFGEGCRDLTVADRATISNMSPEYGATMGFFPVDEQTLKYLKQTGRSDKMVDCVEKYLKAQKMFRLYNESDQKIKYSGKTLKLDLSKLEPCVAGPKRPHDYVPLAEMNTDFIKCLQSPVGFKGYGLSPKQTQLSVDFEYKKKKYTFEHGTIAIAAITSCTNTSNPTVMIGAALIAKKAVELDLKIKPFIKTSLSPGSLTVQKYLEASGLLTYFEKLGIYLTGFGCQTCIGNSGDLEPEIADVIKNNNFVAAAVLSGNRNFEGRIHPLTRANYLMSPMLVTIYALAGNVKADIMSGPISYSEKLQKNVYFKDLWPDQQIIEDTIQKCVLPSMFQETYADIEAGGSKEWKEIVVPKTKLYPWDPSSTYIHDPPFFKTMTIDPEELKPIQNARCLLYLGDSITTDHISPAGAIAKGSPAALYLESHSITSKHYNTYGSRRGNDEVMVRGTFANIRLINKLSTKDGPYTKHFTSGEILPIFDAAMRYKKEKRELIIIAKKEYGAGSSRDWAAKGPYLLGIRAVLAESYERIHRSNLVGMGILPLQFMPSETPATHKLDGSELFSIDLQQITSHGQTVSVEVEYSSKEKKTFKMLSRIDTLVELEYFKHGGILQYVLRNIIKNH